MGGLKDAIKLAAKKAGTEHYRIKELPKQKDTFEELMKSFSTKIQTSFLKSAIGDSYYLWENLEKESRKNGIYARMPYNLIIN